MSRTFAIVPAGGQSTRMGRPKLALPLGDRSVLEHVVAALRQGGAEHNLVVLGSHVAQLAPLAERTGARILVLEKETADMRATVEHGLSWLESEFQPTPGDAWLLAPVDHPTLDPAVIRQLLQANIDRSEYSIFVPTFHGQRGHPTLIRWKHTAGIRTLPLGKGLNVYFRQFAQETLEVSVESAEVLRDLDTPEDYERLLREWRQDRPKNP